jgi:ribosome-binding protein aMBF1 (putative translation factor)
LQQNIYVPLFSSKLVALCKVQNIKDDKFLLLLGKRIKELRIKKGLSQLELAVDMDNHAEQIGRI